MKLIVFTRFGHSRHVNLGHPLVWGGFALLSMLVFAGLFSAGYYTAAHIAAVREAADPVRVELKAQAEEIARTKRDAQADVDALSGKVAELQAHIMRLDAMGAQLTTMAGLKRGEFNFGTPPAEGGPEDLGPVQHTEMPNFLVALDQLSIEVQDREQKLGVLENLFLNRNVQLAAQPAGPPVSGGYISSTFGMRIDPFTGDVSMHSGMDFAGSEGEAVEAVAAGVVTWAGDRSGYGNLVEIDHGNGYATRYGHNETLLVHVGEIVKKGQEIALMGSTGRSTGPHVHFEVLYNGVAVDPAKFVKAAGASRVAVLPQNLD
ncbi:MAG TPA: M23 family metallopeptidase [Gammaproteobacteria bacterium]|nr:M23 family metallopeptidase [Gammaproteobacteria bacterium]